MTQLEEKKTVSSVSFPTDWIHVQHVYPVSQCKTLYLQSISSVISIRGYRNAWDEWQFLCPEIVRKKVKALGYSWIFIDNYTLWTQVSASVSQKKTFLRGFGGFILHQWCRGSKITNGNRRRAGAGSSRPHGCGSEGGGGSRSVGCCGCLTPADETVEGGLVRVLLPRQRMAPEIWRSPQTWNKDSDAEFTFMPDAMFRY